MKETCDLLQSHSFAEFDLAVTQMSSHLRPKCLASLSAPGPRVKTCVPMANAVSLHPSPRRTLIILLSCILDRLFNNPNDTLPTCPFKLTTFHSIRMPLLNIGAYFTHIVEAMRCSESTMIAAMLHISSLYNKRDTPSGIHLNSLTIHRLLLTTLLVTSKFCDDDHFSNSIFAKLGGVPLTELNKMEIDFLALINFNLFISHYEFDVFYKELQSIMLHPKCMCDLQNLPTFQHMSFIQAPHPPQLETDFEIPLKMFV